MSDSLRVSIGQICSSEDVGENLRQIEDLVRRSADAGSDLLTLPENATQLAPELKRLSDAESMDGRQIQTLQEIAAKCGVAICLGSFAEKGPDDTHTYNTSVVIGSDGAVLGSYRKIHLFDVGVDKDTTFSESDSVAAGVPQPVVLELGGWKLGLSICYDIRFPELYRGLSAAGAEVLLVPAAFTFRTGSAHWELLVRARAVENLCFVIATDQVGRHYGSRESWGHSMAVDPWGTVIAQIGEKAGLIQATLHRSRLEETRASLPCLTHRRI
jgi:predicted amidohydrolase